jgi:hypothetical protein
VDSIDALIVKKQAYASKVESLMEAFFDGNKLAPEALDEWLESKVNWL